MQRTDQEIEAQLQLLGFAVKPAVPGYGLYDALRRIQAATVNEYGLPLSVDGGYGPQTERALFGPSYSPANTTLATLAARVAVALLGVTEIPAGSNSGPQIDLILKRIGLGPGYAWCAAFTHFCYYYAAYQLGVKNPHPKDAGVLNLWDLAGFKDVKTMKRISAAAARNNPAQLQIGDLAVFDYGQRKGHIGLLIACNALGELKTVEGNTNSNGSREGIAVQAKQSRKLSNGTLLGFIRFL